MGLPTRLPAENNVYLNCFCVYNNRKNKNKNMNKKRKRKEETSLMEWNGIRDFLAISVSSV